MKSMDMRKSEFRVASATQDATSAERCDFTTYPVAVKPNRKRYQTYRVRNPKHNLTAVSPL